MLTIYNLLPIDYSIEGRDTSYIESLIFSVKKQFTNCTSIVNYYHGNIFIKTEIKPQEVILCNLFGQIFSFPLNASILDQIVINVADLNSGIWYYRIITDHKTFAGSFFKNY
ncbi:MAG: hypothetical protein IPL42_13945 [Saprospiraceae bacterium]|nr:hypothetical protein [Saprospiraceae bacterium]